VAKYQPVQNSDARKGQEETEAMKREIEQLRARIEELERVINRMLPPRAGIGPNAPRIVELAK
jgi:hypothetical protein